MCPGERFEEYYWGKKKFSKRLYFSSFSYFDLTNFLPFGKKRSAGLQKVKFLRIIFFGKKNIKLLPFPVFEQESFGLSAIVSCRLITNAFNASTRMFGGFLRNLRSPHYFRTMSKETNRLLAENFGRIVKLLWIQRNMLARNFFSGRLNLFSSISSFWAKFCGIYVKVFSAELSKLQFTSTEERFDDCFLEKRIFFSSFWNVIYRHLSNFQRK